MINLLPPEAKNQIKFARRNSILIKWLGAIFVVMLLITAMNVFGQFYINQTANRLKETANVTDQRIKEENLEQYKNNLNSLSGDMKTAVQILKKQLLFSKVFPKIGTTLPSGAVLSNVTLNSTDTSLDLTILAKDQYTANQAFTNVKDSNNQLFSKTDLISIVCGDSNPSYPCTAQVKALLNIDLTKRLTDAVAAGGGKLNGLSAISSAQNQYVLTVGTKKADDINKVIDTLNNSPQLVVATAKKGSDCKTDEEAKKNNLEYQCTTLVKVTIKDDASYYFLETTNFTEKF